MWYLKRYLTLFTFTSSLLATSIALAVNSSPNSIKLSTILERLNEQGYSNIHDIEREGDVLKIEGMSDKGDKYELHINRKSGKILNKRQYTKKILSILDVAKKLEARGYKHIDEIEFDEGVYKVKVNLDQKEKELHVDASSGKIKEDN